MFGATSFTTPYFPPDCDIWLVCFANRSGSNYLGHLLAASGACNEPGEFFNAETIAHHAQNLNLHSLSAYMQALPGLVGHPKIFAAKAALDHLVMLTQAGILPALLPRTKFILIERQDRLAQAISRAIASQNLRWTSEMEAAIADENLIYNRGEITEEINRVQTAMAGLYRFFSANQITPFHLSYEELLKNPQDTLNRIGSFCNLGPLPYHPERVRITRQSNRINEEWREKYLNSKEP